MWCVFVCECVLVRVEIHFSCEEAALEVQVQTLQVKGTYRGQTLQVRGMYSGWKLQVRGL